MSERHYFNINDPADVLENASYIALLVGYNLDDTDKRDLEEYYSLLDSYNASQVGCRTITKRIQELPRNSDGTIAPCAEKQYQELIKMNENAKEYEEKHRKTLQYFLEHSTLVHTLQRKHKEKCKQENLRKQEEEQQPKSETAPCLVQPNKTEAITPQKNKKSRGLIAFCIILAILVIGATTIFFVAHQNKEYTITYYNNKGIYFYTSYPSGEERMVTNHQDNTIYKVDKFRGKYPTEPTPPTNKGYVFLGWYKNPECTDKFLFGHYEIKGNINLYAKWGRGN